MAFRNQLKLLKMTINNQKNLKNTLKEMSLNM